MVVLAKYNLLLFVFFVFSIPHSSFSQQETFNWTLSHNKKLNFSSSPPVINNIPYFRNFETSTTISNETGNWLYYTNGLHVFDSSHNIINNGNDITNSDPTNISSGSIFSSTQGCVFEKFPRNNSLILLFTLDAFESKQNLSYNIINQSSNSVIHKRKFLLSGEKLTEKMIIADHCNHTDKWLIVIEIDGNPEYFSGFKHYKKIIFHSFFITENGVQNYPISSSINLVDFSIPYFGQMKINNKGNQITLGNNKGISLFKFDNSTGKIEFEKNIDFQSFLAYKYGIEYSPDDKIIYADENQIEVSSGQCYNYMGKNQISQLQIGADDKIYRLTFPDSIYMDGTYTTNGKFGVSLDKINNPNSINFNCNYEPNLFEFIDSGFVSLSFPNIPQHLFNRNKAEFSYLPSCQGDSTELYLTNSYLQFDLIKWEVNGVEYANEDTISVYFPAEGTYSVTCYVEKDSLTFSSTQCVTVCGPSDVILPPLINICASDSIVLNTMNTCSLSYLWNTGDTTSAIVIKDEGIYWIKTTNVCGVSYDTIIVEKEDCIPLVEIPNVFTPNYDQQNEIFTIQIRDVKSLKVYIVNRWGELIKDTTINLPFQNISSDNTIDIWDGLVNQNEAVEGVYFYKVSYFSENEIEYEKTGFFHLIR